MKKYILYILVGIASWGLASCNGFLDVDQYFNDLYQLDSVFTKRSTTEQWLWKVYSRLDANREICNKMSSGFNFASDDLFYGDRTATVPCQSYQNCEYSPSKMLNEDRWGNLYCGIREASTFISNVDQCTELTNDQIEDYKAQARFLRAYFYWMLIKQWGPVPLLPDEGLDINLSYEELSTPRNTYDECVDYIVAEFEEAAIHLEQERSTAYLGMATKGAALAARAKVLLYAASPLYNGNHDLFELKDEAGNPLINQNYDERKWARAAAAAEEVINTGWYELYTVPVSEETVLPPAEVRSREFPYGCGGIDPYESYRQLFNGAIRDMKDNREFIFYRQFNNAGATGGEDLIDLVKHSYPHNSGWDGWNTNAVSLKQVDAYYMFDGRDKDNASEGYPYHEDGFITADDADSVYKFVNRASEEKYQVSRRFGNREPRFYASISFNGCVWESENAYKNQNGTVDIQNKPCNYYRGRENGKTSSEPEFCPFTGIGLFKYYHPDDTWQTSGAVYQTYKVEPTIRYADVLLWYAEALNELTQEYSFPTYDGRGTVTVSRNVEKMRSAFSQVRFRAGLPDADNYDDAAQFRVTLKRERQIELFAESARYFDLRRWKDAPTEEVGPIKGFNINITSSKREDFYKETVISRVQKRWMDKMYLWPIPKNETDRNVKLQQNPGWER